MDGNDVRLTVNRELPRGGRWLTRQTAVAEAVPPAARARLVGVLLVVGDDGGHPPDGQLHLHAGRSVSYSRGENSSGSGGLAEGTNC